MKTLVLSPVLCAVLLSAAPRQADPATVKLPPELDRVLRDYERGWAKGDGQALAELFTEDGFVLQPNRPPIQGRKAISERYQRDGSPLHLRAFGFAMEGSVAYIIGGYAYEQGAADHGKYTLTLRKVEGKWLIASDMDSGNHSRT